MRFSTLGKYFVCFCLIFIFVTIRLSLLSAPEEKTSIFFEGECLTDNIITVREGGRLGNCVWEYVSVLGLQDALKLTPYVPKSIANCLGKAFKNLRIPAYEDTLLSETCRKAHGGDVKKCETETLPQNSTWDRLCYLLKHGDSITPEVALKPISALRELKDSGQLPSILILPQWIAQAHAFAEVGISRLKQELQFRDDVRELAEETINGVREKVGNRNLTFVGVHVRRKDYLGYLTKRLGNKVAYADLHYYKNAMSRMHDLYNDSRLVFVVVSDDYSWCKMNLVNEKEGVFWGGLERSSFMNNWKEKRDMGAFHDLALLSMQNHSIIGYGTYALTGSLLSGGHMIVCNIAKNGELYDFLTLRLCKILPNCEML